MAQALNLLAEMYKSHPQFMLAVDLCSRLCFLYKVFITRGALYTDSSVAKVGVQKLRLLFGVCEGGGEGDNLLSLSLAGAGCGTSAGCWQRLFRL